MSFKVCVVIGCNNKATISFPKNETRRTLCTAMVQRKDWYPSNSSRICDAHFTPDCFEHNTNVSQQFYDKKILTKHAIPTIFPKSQDGTLRMHSASIMQYTNEVAEEGSSSNSLTNSINSFASTTVSQANGQPVIKSMSFKICAVVGCSNKGTKSFPKDKTRRALWAKMLQRKNWFPGSSSRICDAHFAPDAFLHNNSVGQQIFGKKALSKDAVPTIFPYNTDMASAKPHQHLTVEDVISPSSARKVAASQDSIVHSKSNNVAHKSSLIPFIKCSAVGCGNKATISFPKDKSRRRLWANMLQRKNWYPSNSSRICEIHFEPGCFLHNNHVGQQLYGRKVLSGSAIPTRFFNNQITQSNMAVAAAQLSSTGETDLKISTIQDFRLIGVQANAVSFVANSSPHSSFIDWTVQDICSLLQDDTFDYVETCHKSNQTCADFKHLGIQCGPSSTEVGCSPHSDVSESDEEEMDSSDFSDDTE